MIRTLWAHPALLGTLIAIFIIAVIEALRTILFIFPQRRPPKDTGDEL